MIHVSVIIPAWNAEEFIRQTLDSVCKQTYTHWEAVVVDDGSVDSTAEIVRSYSDGDSRFLLIQQEHKGVSSARNRGTEAARNDWVLYLDADDVILPNHLASLCSVLETNPSLDAVYCGAARLTPEGEVIFPTLPDVSGDLFPTLARYAVFSIHTCVLRRELVQRVGGWDRRYITCEDWDLWMRVARAGARFGTVRDVLALYRMRRGSSSTIGYQLLKDGLSVMQQARSEDLRVPHAVPQYANGCSDTPWAEIIAGHIFYVAALLIGEGKPLLPVLQQFDPIGTTSLHYRWIAEVLFEYALHSSCRPPREWMERWPEWKQTIEEFLIAAEDALGTTGLARQVHKYLLDLIVQHAPGEEPAMIEDTCRIVIDVERDLPDLTQIEHARRCVCIIRLRECDLAAIGFDVEGEDWLTKGYILRRVLASIHAWMARRVKVNLQSKVAAATSLVRWPDDSSSDPLSGDLRKLTYGSKHGQFADFSTASMHLLAQITASNRIARRAAKLRRLLSKPREEENEFDKIFAAKPDPWEYTSDYEQIKYEQTLALVPKHVNRAIEIGCAEGRFTMQLAPRAKKLVAADISSVALQRASESCRVSQLNNVEFWRLDITRDAIPGRFDLIICGEVLYYLDKLQTLQEVAERLARSLAPKGRLLLVHANLIKDDPYSSGFDWEVSFGAQVIGETFNAVPELNLVQELRTPLYRIHAFERSDNRSPSNRSLPELNEMPQPALPVGAAQASMVWRRSSQYVAGAFANCPRQSVPVLMYHRIAPSGADALRRYRVHPDCFEAQMRFLDEAGYDVISLPMWIRCMRQKSPLLHRSVILTFDDGYLDFWEHALPVLNKYGFTASIFAVADRVGQTNVWDSESGEQIPLMGGAQLRALAEAGFHIGSHTLLHPRLTHLGREELMRELRCSRERLQHEIGQEVDSIAYPFGDQDWFVRRAAAEAGYQAGLTCVDAPCTFSDDPLNIPRLEICADLDLTRFIETVRRD